jgi:hypothetical protein
VRTEERTGVFQFSFGLWDFKTPGERIIEESEESEKSEESAIIVFHDD